MVKERKRKQKKKELKLLTLNFVEFRMPTGSHLLRVFSLCSDFDCRQISSLFFCNGEEGGA